MKVRELCLVIAAIVIMVLLVVKGLAFIPVVYPYRYVEFLFIPVMYLTIRGGWKLALVPWMVWMYFHFVFFGSILHFDLMSIFSIIVVLFLTQHVHKFFQRCIKNNYIDFYFTISVVTILRILVGEASIYLDGLYSRLGIDIFTFYFVYRLFVEKIVWEILFTIFIISILKKCFPETGNKDVK